MRNKVCLKVLTVVTGILVFVFIILETKQGSIVLKGSIQFADRNRPAISSLRRFGVSTKNSSEPEGKPGIDDLAEVISLDGVDYCQNVNDSDIIVVVPSGAPNLDRRLFIRTTWAKSKIFSKIIFIIGKTESQSMEQAILEESKQLKDILRIDAPDSYKGLVFRLLSVYKWLNKTCHKGYIMKVDDDILIHPGNFIKSGIMDKLRDLTNEKVVYGRLLGPTLVPRSGKWGLTKTEWPFDRLPMFANGFTYIMTQPALTAILKAFDSDAHYIWCEDVYITGILLKSGGGKLKRMKMFDDKMQGGEYMSDISRLRLLAKKNSNQTTGLVELIPLKKMMTNITFFHVVTNRGFHPKGFEFIREFIWGTLWEMDSGTRHIQRAKLDFW